MEKFIDIKNTIELIDQNIDNIQSFIEELTQDDPGFFDPKNELFIIASYKIKIGMYKEAIKDLEDLNTLVISCIPSLLMSYCYYKLEDEENKSTYQEKVKLIHQEIQESKVSQLDLITAYLVPVIYFMEDGFEQWNKRDPKTTKEEEHKALVELIKNQCYQEGIEKALKLSEKELLGFIMLYRILSYCSLKLQNPDKAVEYFNKSNIFYNDYKRLVNSINIHYKKESKFHFQQWLIECKNHLSTWHQERGRNDFKKYPFLTETYLINEKYEYGIDYLNNGDYQSALNEFISAIALCDNFYLSYLNVGYCFFKLDQYEKAIQYYEKAYELNPTEEFLEKLYEVHTMFFTKDEYYLTYQNIIVEYDNRHEIISIPISLYSYTDFLQDITVLLEFSPQHAILKDIFNYFKIKELEFQKKLSISIESTAKGSACMKQKKYKAAFDHYTIANTNLFNINEYSFAMCPNLGKIQRYIVDTYFMPKS